MSAKAKDPSRFYAEFVKGIWQENPVFVMVLGMCPTLAVTNTALNGFLMGACTFFVLFCSSTLISLLRNHIPKQVRISTFIVIIATFVTIVDFAMKWISLELHAMLGAFISLIVVNCIILGRAEAFASRNRPRYAIADALGMALGFWLALLMLASAREILGFGTLFRDTNSIPFVNIDWEISVFGSGFEPWGVMVSPPGGFIMLGLILLVFNALSARRKRLRAEMEEEQRTMEEGRAG
jgi:electron transport complex protein RnfE